MRVRPALLLALLVVGGAPEGASGHVAPAVDVNNRYLKLSPTADQLRLAYTIYFGERPGALLRRDLDDDRDGVISDAEAATLGRRLGVEVAAALEVTIDGAPTTLRWANVDVGLGDPSARGGSFAVDLIAWVCAPGGAGTRDVRLRDRYPLPLAGETGLRVEDAPGLAIEHSRLGRDDLGPDATIRNAASALSAEGWQVRYRVDAGAARGPSACARSADSPAGHGRWWVIAALTASLVLGGGAVAWWRRREGAAKPPS